LRSVCFYALIDWAAQKVVPDGLMFYCGLLFFFWHFAAVHLRAASVDRRET